MNVSLNVSLLLLFKCPLLFWNTNMKSSTMLQYINFISLAKVARIDENLTVQNANQTNAAPITTTTNTINSENGEDTMKSPTKANNSLSKC